jgi:galactokinase
LNKVGDLINMSQASLRDNLKVSSDYLDSLCLAALSSGAYGAKLTGAGVGGCMFAICDSLTENSVVESLERQGAKVYRFSYSKNGIVIENNEKNFINGLQYTYGV